MRLWTILLALALALLVALPVRAWENDDYEIFELQAALESAEGRGTTFYSMLNLTKEATAQQIKTAYRKRSVELHPDKHPSNPAAAKRFERLGLINKILRDQRKDRYDHFLSTGFPRWRGTGYYYERFRPGLISVLFGVVGLTVLVEYLVKRLNFIRDSGRVGQLRKAALYQAWGPRFFQILHNAPGAPSVAAEKKIKLQLASLPELPKGPTPSEVKETKVDWDSLEKEVRKSGLISGSSAPLNPDGPARTVDVLVTRESDGEGIVWVLDAATGEWSELSEEKMIAPSFRDSWPLRLVRSVQDRATGGTGGSEASPLTTEGKEEAANMPAQPAAASTAVKGRKGGKRR